MSRKGNKISLNSFYCMNCGEKSMDLPRNAGKQHEKFHRKVLWCPHCQMEINHVECRNDAERFEFKNNYTNGVYENEKEKSISFVRMSR